MSATAEIFVVTGPGQGHLHPCMELCLHLTRLGYLATLVIPSHLSSAIPPSFSSNPLVAVAPIAGSSGPPMRVSDPLNQPAGRDLSAHLEKRAAAAAGVLCAVVDFQVGWTKEVFWKFDVPVVSFVAFSACAAAMELGAWRAEASDVRPGEARLIPGLPEEMAIVHSDLKRKPFGPPRGGPPGPGPKPGGRPPWVPEVEGSIGLMFNSCGDLEQPFLDYMGDQMKMPLWGIGQLLPEQYWKAPGGALISDRVIRQHGRESSCTEDEVVQWLDGKPRRSVLYVAFGSEVGPDEEELAQLAAALEESARAFIWVIGSKSGGDFADGMEGRVGDRGLIIRGWAPQLLILSHPSTGGFLSHRGWNSMVEVVGQAWPSRGDQHHNAKLGVSHRHQKMGNLFGWNSTAETSTHRSPLTWPFPGKRNYSTDSPGDHLKVENVASNDMPKNVMDDESKGIGKTVALEALASFQFDLKFQCQIGRLQIGASISRLARSMR